MTRNLPKPPPPPGAATAEIARNGDGGPGRWPMRIVWPADARVAVIGEQWRRLRSGKIEATYNDIEELGLAIELTKLAREEKQAETGPIQIPMQEVGGVK